MGGSTIVKSNRIAQVLASLHAALDEAADAIAKDIHANSAPNIPVDTGSMQAGEYVSSALTDGYQEAASTAGELNPAAVILDAVDKPKAGSGRAYVANAVGHAEAVEYGGAFMAARPVLHDAFASAIDRVEDLIGGVVRKAVE